MKGVLSGFLFLAAGSSAMAACTDVRPLVCPLPLTVHYDPATNVNATTRLYTPPPIDKCTSAGELGDVVQNAFRLAQGKLQDEICALTKIFIVSDYSWGFWENPANDQTPNGEKPRSFVAIELSLLSKTLDEVEDGYLRTVLRQGAGANLSHSVTNAGTGTPAAIKKNRIYLGTLGVLAHEIGRIKWHRDNIYSSLPCYYDKFAQPSWSKPELLAFYKRTWVPPSPNNDVSGNIAHANHGGMRVPHPNDSTLTIGDVRKIYDTRNPVIDGFVTAFAASSPEEDFAETYRIVALKTNRQFSNLKMNLSGPGLGNPIAVLEQRNPVVTAKMSCVSDSLFGPNLLRLDGSRSAARRSS
jgi:hypothetical protein